ncbi:MAG: AI-2E family transporter [Planctomycetes bacterium]|jgi:predicted PurR-regulated permease PerM|nr:AI-2E family transporter [Planctomycetota bacterium]
MADGHHPTPDSQPQDPGDAAHPIWRRRWFQFLLGATAVFVFLSFVIPPIFGLIYAVRSVLTPVVFALVLAYIFNPVVTWMDRKLRIPRWGGTTVIMGVGALVLLVSLGVGVPILVEQGSSLINKLQDAYPKVLESIAEDTGAELPDSLQEDAAPDDAPSPQSPAENGTDTQTATAYANGETDAAKHDSAFRRLLASEPVQKMLTAAMTYFAELDWSTAATTALRTMDVGTSVVGSAISVTMYWLVFIMVALFSFFFLSWKLGEFMNWFVPFIPIDHRERTLEILVRMDRTVSAWLRGRLVQALLLAIMLTVGWAIAGVPYWFLLGVISGVLGLVPYLIVVGWAIALLLTALDSMAGGSFSWWVLLWPTLVYVIAQTIDGWVVEPLLQGKATEMGTLTVLLVVMIGGVLGGVLGLLIAIPVAACIKILCVELVLPKLRELAAQPSLI